MITEIPSFLLVNEAKTPNDAVLINRKKFSCRKRLSRICCER